MRVRNITTCALGLAAALTVVASPLAAQSQDTTKLRRTTSDQRINISKGEVAAPRVDTVYVTRFDTVRVNNTVVRVDTVTVMAPMPVIPAKIRGPMFWGVFAGTTWPWGNIDRIYVNGYHAGGVLGWESQNSPIGLRLDGAVSQIGRETMTGYTTDQVGIGTPLILHLAADLKAKALMFGGWAFYGIGGVNYQRYKRIALASTSDNTCNFTVRGACYENANTSWSDKFGYNFGVGTDFHIGSQDMFLEARYFATPSNGATSWTLPVSLGVRYF